MQETKGATQHRRNGADCSRQEGGPQAAAADPTPQEKKGEATDTAQTSSVEQSVSVFELAFNGAMAGVLYGALLGLVFSFIAYFAHTDTQLVGAAVAIPISVSFAAVAGSIVGIVAVLTRYLIAGIVTALVVDSAMKLTVMAAANLWWGFTVGGVMLTLLCSVVFGWVVTNFVLRSINWDMVD